MIKRSLYFILFIFTLFASQQPFAQHHNKDSLLSIALRAEPDSNSVLAIKTLQRDFFNAGLTDSALNYSHLLINITKKIGDTKGLAKAYFNLGSVYMNLFRTDSAIYYNQLAEQEALETKDSFLLVHCYTNFSNQYRNLNDYTTSLDYAIKGANIARHSSDSSIIKVIPKLYSNMANCLIAQKQLTDAIAYGKKALEITNYPDEQRYRILILLDIIDAFLKLDRAGQAEAYMDMVVNENDRFNNVILDILTYNTQGFYFSRLKKHPLAIQAFLNSYRLCDSVKNDFLKSEVANNIALGYINQKQYDKALPFAREGRELSVRLKQYRIAANSFAALKMIAAAEGNYEQAYQYAEKYKDYADSTTNLATQRQIVSLEKKYETEKNEKTIADLTIANTAQELAVAKRNRWLIGGGISAVLLLVILGLLYRNSQQKRLIVKKENILNQEQIKFLERQQQVVSLQSMINGQETERTRIAKDLHDGLGGLFSTIKMYFSTLKHEQPALQENAIFEKSYDLVDTASEEVRRIAHNMMPEVLMKLGLVHALQDMCSNISAGKLLQVKLQSYGMEKRMNASTEIMLYRIVQELLNNIIKHADATKVIVQFNREADHLAVTVEDNGRGFNLQETDGNRHTGLETIKSRVNYLNGNISIDSEEEVGTTVLMEFLLNDDSATV